MNIGTEGNKGLLNLKKLSHEKWPRAFLTNLNIANISPIFYYLLKCSNLILNGFMEKMCVQVCNLYSALCYAIVMSFGGENLIERNCHKPIKNSNNGNCG